MLKLFILIEEFITHTYLVICLDSSCTSISKLLNSFSSFRIAAYAKYEARKEEQQSLAFVVVNAVNGDTLEG